MCHYTQARSAHIHTERERDKNESSIQLFKKKKKKAVVALWLLWQTEMACLTWKMWTRTALLSVSIQSLHSREHLLPTSAKISPSIVPHRMYHCTAGPWHPAESPSSPPPLPDYGIGSREVLLRCHLLSPRCVHSPYRLVSGGDGGGGGAAAVSVAAAAADPPHLPRLCSYQSRSLRRCCRKDCRCCRPRTRRTRRRISAGSRTGSGPLPGETAPFARTPPSLSVVMLLSPPPPFSFFHSLSHPFTTSSVACKWSRSCRSRRRVCLQCGDHTLPCRPGSDAEPGGQQSVDPVAAVRFKGTGIFPPPCSAHSAAHWAKSSIVLAQHPGWETSELFIHSEE